MVTIEHAEAAAACQVTARMRAADRAEVEAQVGPFSPQSLALGHLAISRPACWTILENAEPIGLWGIARTALPHIGNVWAWGTDRFPRAVPTITRMIPDVATFLREEGLRRLEIRSIVTHDISHRWLESERVGFTREAILRSYGRGDEDFVLYSMVL